MKKFLFAAAAVLFFSASAARADFYISGGLGINVNDSSVKTLFDGGEIKDRYENSPVYALALGYDLPFLPLRFELEGLRTSSDVKTPVNVGGLWMSKTETMTVNAAMANAYVRIPFVGLYAGVGAGYGKVMGETTPLYQGMIGVEYPILILPLHVGLEYRHIQAVNDFKEITSFNSINDFTSAKSKFKADAVMIKARIDF